MVFVPDSRLRVLMIPDFMLIRWFLVGCLYIPSEWRLVATKTNHIIRVLELSAPSGPQKGKTGERPMANNLINHAQVMKLWNLNNEVIELLGWWTCSHAGNVAHTERKRKLCTYLILCTSSIWMFLSCILIIN